MYLFGIMSHLHWCTIATTEVSRLLGSASRSTLKGLFRRDTNCISDIVTHVARLFIWWATCLDGYSLQGNISTLLTNNTQHTLTHTHTYTSSIDSYTKGFYTNLKGCKSHYYFRGITKEGRRKKANRNWL